MRKEKKHRKILLVIFGIIFLIFAGKFILDAVKLTPFLFELLFKKEIQLKKNDDRVNILLMGRGGGTHQGPDLTDTIILANIDPEKSHVTLTSIPRDLWIPDLSSANKKINGVYAQGESKREGGGIELSKAVVKKVTGQEVNYIVVIDFSGFIRAVDLLNGLDIKVDKTFDDYQYPIEGREDEACGHTEDEIKEYIATSSADADLLSYFPCRYKHIHFEKGDAHMDGKTALEFVRSRHGTNGEGSDFARSKRQERVIKAFKDKIFSLQTLSNPGKVLNLYNILKDSIDTDIKENEFDDFIKLMNKMEKAQIKSAALDTGDSSGKDGLLEYAPISEEYGFLSVLIPKAGNGNFSVIHLYEQCQIEGKNCEAFPTQSN